MEARIAVLGCGPAGLFAAHAAEQVFGKGSVEVFSNRPQPSRLNGCQYLHEAIEGVDCGTGRTVHWETWGTTDDYVEKVYGKLPVGSVSSAEEYGQGGTHTAWDLRRAYRYLWNRWRDNVHPVGKLSYGSLGCHLEEWEPDLVLSTIPRTALCAKRGASPVGVEQSDLMDIQPCYFTSQLVWALGDAPEIQMYAPFRPESFTVICNGRENPRWYRAANVFDYVTCEWPHDPRPPLPGLAEVVKPLRSNCRCHEKFPCRVVILGRYGKWEKGYLIHQAYQDALSACRDLEGQGVQGVLL